MSKNIILTATLITWWGGMNSVAADDRIYVPQVAPGTGTAFVRQALDLPDHRIIQRADPNPTTQTPRSPQASISPPAADTRIWELSAPSVPTLPDAHVAVR